MNPKILLVSITLEFLCITSFIAMTCDFYRMCNYYLHAEIQTAQEHNKLN